MLPQHGGSCPSPRQSLVTSLEEWENDARLLDSRRGLLVLKKCMLGELGGE